MPDPIDTDRLTCLYFDRVTAHMRRILDEEKSALDAAAGKLADQIAADRLVHVYGPGGHSNLAAQEIFFRAGGLCTSAPSSTKARCCRTARCAPWPSRTPGYGKVVITDNRLGDGDLLLLAMPTASTRR